MMLFGLLFRPRMRRRVFLSTDHVICFGSAWQKQSKSRDQKDSRAVPTDLDIKHNINVVHILLTLRDRLKLPSSAVDMP